MVRPTSVNLRENLTSLDANWLLAVKDGCFGFPGRPEFSS